MSYKSEIFRDILDQFETESFKNFCIDLLEARDDLNYHIPSSTSYKYHNKTQCQPGGQIYHELMVATIMNYILSLEYIQCKYTDPKQRDCMRIAACMHDCKKTNGGKFTVHEHPILGAEFVETVNVEHQVDPKFRKYIGQLIKCHMGQWFDSKKSDVLLPKPVKDDEFLLHLCDLLGSRSNLDMIYSDEVKDLVNNNLPEEQRPDPNNWTFPFGKYKGLMFSEVLDSDKSYLLWLRDKADMEIREPLKTLLSTI